MLSVLILSGVVLGAPASAAIGVPAASTGLIAPFAPIAAAAAGAPGETLPKGPPWHVTYRAAKRDAIRHGRPVFVYFTKTY